MNRPELGQWFVLDGYAEKRRDDWTQITDRKRVAYAPPVTGCYIGWRNIPIGRYGTDIEYDYHGNAIYYWDAQQTGSVELWLFALNRRSRPVYVFPDQVGALTTGCDGIGQPVTVTGCLKQLKTTIRTGRGVQTVSGYQPATYDEPRTGIYIGWRSLPVGQTLPVRNPDGAFDLFTFTATDHIQVSLCVLDPRRAPIRVAPDQIVEPFT